MKQVELCNAHFFLGNQDYTQDTALEKDRPMFLFVGLVLVFCFVLFFKGLLTCQRDRG